MDNFEYSIYLSDRDWAEFYSVAEECHLKQPSLATADDQVLSDHNLSDLEPEENLQEEGHTVTCRQVRVSLCARNLSRKLDPLDHCTRSISRHGVLVQPQALCPEDVLSGSDDEEDDLGSVSRFLCERDAPWPGAAQTSRIVMQHMRSRAALAHDDTTNEQNDGGWTPQHNEGYMLTASLPKPCSGFQPDLMTEKGVTPQKYPELDQAMARGLVASLQAPPSSEDTGLPAEWRRKNPSNAGDSTTGSVDTAGAGASVLCHSQAVPLTGAHHNRGTSEEELDAELIQPHRNQAWISEDCTNDSPESLFNRGNPGGMETEGTKTQYSGKNNIACNHIYRIVEQEPPSVLQSMLSENATTSSELVSFSGMHLTQANSLQLLSQVETTGMQLNGEVSGPILSSKGGKGVELLSFTGNSQPGNGTLIEHLTSCEAVGPNLEENINDMRRSPLAMEAVDVVCPNQLRDYKLPTVETLSPDPSPSDHFNMATPEALDFFCELCMEGLSDGRGSQGSRAWKGWLPEGEGSHEWVGKPEICEYFFCEDQENEGAERAPLLPAHCSRMRPPHPKTTDTAPHKSPDSISFPEAYEYFFNDEVGGATGQRTMFLGMLSSLRATGLAAVWRSLLPRRRAHVQARSESRKNKGEIRTIDPKLLIPVQRSPILTEWRFQDQAEESQKAVAVKALLANLGAVAAIRYLRRRAGGDYGMPFAPPREGQSF